MLFTFMDDDDDIIGETEISVARLAETAGEEGCWHAIEFETDDAGKVKIVIEYEQPESVPTPTSLPPQAPPGAPQVAP